MAIFIYFIGAIFSFFTLTYGMYGHLYTHKLKDEDIIFAILMSFFGSWITFFVSLILVLMTIKIKFTFSISDWLNNLYSNIYSKYGKDN